MDTEQQVEFTVDATARFHPIAILVNFLFLGVILAGLYWLIFDNKAMYGVVIFIAIGVFIRFVIISVLNMYLRRKMRKL